MTTREALLKNESKQNSRTKQNSGTKQRRTNGETLPGQSKRSLTTFIVRLLVSILACIILIQTIEWQAVPRYIFQAQATYLLLAAVATKLAILISAYKWFILCRKSAPVFFKQCWKWYYIGFFFNNFMPGSIGGDIARGYYAGKEMGYSHSVASITVERLFAGIALVTIAMIGLLWTSQSYAVVLVISTLFFGCLYLILFHPVPEKWLVKRFGERLQRFYDIIKQYKQHKGLLVQLFVCSLLFQVCFVWITDLIFRALGVEVSFMVQLGFVSLISILTMIPISLNGFGVREGGYAYFFSLVGVQESVSVATSLLFIVMVMVCTSIGGIFWWLNNSREKAHHM